MKQQIKSIQISNPARTALFPIRKITKQRYKNPDKEYRKQYSSADWIGYILMGLERGAPRKYIVEPTVTSMRAEKIKNIILVDDIIGSGGRVEDFWKNFDPSIKSWISYKKCNIWVVSYAGHQVGIDFIISKIAPLNNENIKCELTIPKVPQIFTKEVKNICRKYGFYTLKPSASLGYKNSMNNIIFEYGCPNNTPAILWVNGPKWNALFSDRYISDDLVKFFKKRNYMTELNNLFDVNQKELSLNLLKKIEKNEVKGDTLYLLIILGFIQRGYRYNKLQTLVFLEKSKLESILKNCLTFRLITSHGAFNKQYRLTEWGRDLLLRYKKTQAKINKKEKEIDVYYPLQFSNKPAKV